MRMEPSWWDSYMDRKRPGRAFFLSLHHVRLQKEESHLQTGRQPSPDTRSASTLIYASKPLELWGIHGCVKPPSQWHFVTAAWTNTRAQELLSLSAQLPEYLIWIFLELMKDISPLLEFFSWKNLWIHYFQACLELCNSQTDYQPRNCPGVYG